MTAPAPSPLTVFIYPAVPYSLDTVAPSAKTIVDAGKVVVASTFKLVGRDKV